MLTYPDISPILLKLGPLEFRWYGLMYAIGFIIAFRILTIRARNGLLKLDRSQCETLLFWLIVGMLIGARVVYVIAYNGPYYLSHPLESIAFWHGGLSFHGGVIGIAIAAWLFAKRYRLTFAALTDSLAVAGTPGLFFGRMGNFINGELYGRPTNVPWAMIFPDDPLQVPRHPSQLYEAFGEGALLFIALLGLQRMLLRHPCYKYGYLSAAFLIGYGTIRFGVEFTRQPDNQLGFIWESFSMGQMLSTGMIMIGGIIFWRAYVKQPPASQRES